MRRGFFDLPDWITTVQPPARPRFTGTHALESDRSRGQCWKCRRMIGRRGESYLYVLRLLGGVEDLHACRWCHGRMSRRAWRARD